MIVMTMLLIVAVDVPFQLWQYHDKLKMSKDEVKQEGKEMEGNPQVKGRIRQLQREAARKRMMGAVPTADVIVTNPTHFAVALAYKSGMGAPKVLAKGMGDIALKIREIGAQNGVPMLEAPPLARALYRHAELDQEIPSTLYAAVAEVLAYVFQLANWRQVGGSYPMPPRSIAVPAELVPELING
jgi:flagellar biosynthetic protein FlhB